MLMLMRSHTNIKRKLQTIIKDEEKNGYFEETR